MISVIIASADKNNLDKVAANIEATIGVPFEIISFDNSGGQRGICALYNEGMARASFSLLCFMHEDISIETPHWGRVVSSVFQGHPEVGVLGISGSTYKSLTPSGWLNHSDIQPVWHNYLQSFKYTEKETIHRYANPENGLLQKVVAVDGVWLCVRKSLTDAVQFDAKTFSGFHCYDVDFCLSARRYTEVAVTFEVLIHHYSEGRYDCLWWAEIIKLHQKWDAHLPQATTHFTRAELQKIEKQNFKYFIKNLPPCGFSLAVAYRFLWRIFYLRKLGPKLFLKFHYYLLKIKAGIGGANKY